jgi:hypothetical protein
MVSGRRLVAAQTLPADIPPHSRKDGLRRCGLKSIAFYIGLCATLAAVFLSIACIAWGFDLSPKVFVGLACAFVPIGLLLWFVSRKKGG